MEINYSKLRSRIIEKYGTISNFSKASGYSGVTVSGKLNGKTPFTLKEIHQWINLLNIEREEILSFFFTK